jgi:hypothetical protein
VLHDFDNRALVGELAEIYRQALGQPLPPE